MAASARWPHPARAAVLLVLVLWISACASNAAEVPSTYATLDGRGFAVSFPGDWQVTVSTEQEAAALDGDPDTAVGAPSVRAAFDGPMTGPLEANASAGARLGALATGPRQFLVEEAIDVAGADAGWVVESTWRQDTDDGPVAMRQLDIYSVLDGDLAYLGVVAPDAEFGDVQRTIVATYRRIPTSG